MQISEEDHARIAEAVAQAERTTSSEICCVLASGAVDYRFSATIIAAATALIAPAAAVALGLDPSRLAGLFGAWRIGHDAAAQMSALALYIVVQAAIFAGVFLLAAFAPLRRALTPAAVVKARVHAAALDQFEALGLSRTRDRTGVLIYASLADHRAEVLADVGIYDKAPHQVWDEVVALLIADLKTGDLAHGFVRSIEKTGTILSDYLPSRSDDTNELPDRLNIRP